MPCHMNLSLMRDVEMFLQNAHPLFAEFHDLLIIQLHLTTQSISFSCIMQCLFTPLNLPSLHANNTVYHQFQTLGILENLFGLSATN